MQYQAQTQMHAQAPQHIVVVRLSDPVFSSSCSCNNDGGSRIFLTFSPRFELGFRALGLWYTLAAFSYNVYTRTQIYTKSVLYKCMYVSYTWILLDTRTYL